MSDSISELSADPRGGPARNFPDIISVISHFVNALEAGPDWWQPSFHPSGVVLPARSP